MVKVSMSSQFAMSLMSVAEFAGWAALALLFWRKSLSRRFPAMGAYLALRLSAAPVLLLLLHGNSIFFPSNQWLILYFFVFWAVYITSVVLLYFVCIEVFRSALSAFPGLMKLGLVVFRWAVLPSVIVTFSSISFAHKGVLVIPEIAFGLMRAVSILELSLFAFLCLSLSALRLSVRDRAFGIALGFGMISANDFVAASLQSLNVALTAPLQVVYESMILVALGTWIVYFILPEPAHKPVMVPVNSTIYRWNEIASALGHTGTQVAVPHAGNAPFLTDVDSVVDRVLARNLKDRKSET
jgi:hypothetical protein